MKLVKLSVASTLLPGVRNGTQGGRWLDRELSLVVVLLTLAEVPKLILVRLKSVTALIANAEADVPPSDVEVRVNSRESKCGGGTAAEGGGKLLFVLASWVVLS